MSPRSKALERAAPGLVLAALVMAVWSDPLWTGRNFTGRDLLAYNLPMEKVIHDAYAAGHLPIWNPWISGGRPLLANPNSGALYPARALLAVLSFPLAMRIYPPLHWTAAGLGVLFLLRALRLRREAAWLGAVTYAFSGVAISEVFYPHIQPGFALLPWILWAVASRPRFGPRGTVLLGLLFGLDFLGGDVFTGGLAAAAALLWIATETERVRRPAEGRALAVAVGLGALLAAPQIAATALWIPETNRAVLGMKLSDATLFSVSPMRLLEFVVPYPFGPTWRLEAAGTWCWKAFNGKAIGLFSTLFAGFLAPMAVVRLRRSRAAGLPFARWLLIGGLAVAVVPSLFPQSWMHLKSPVPLRNPEKLVVATVLALAVFAARGFEEFVAAPPRGRALLAIGGVFAAAALACAIRPAAAGRAAATLLDGTPRRAGAAAEHLPGALAEAGLLWMATVLALAGARSSRRPVRIAAVGVLALATIVPCARIPEISLPAEAFAPTRFASLIRSWDPAGSFRVLGEAIYRAPTPADLRGERSSLAIVELPRRDWIQHTQALWERGTVFNADFDSGDLSRVESLRRVSGVAAGFGDAGAFFGNLSLRWGIRMTTQTRPVAGYLRIGGDRLQDWDEQSPAQPDVRLAASWREEPGALEALRDLPHVGHGELLVETGRRGAFSARPGSVRVLERRPGRLRLECDGPDSTWLFVLRAFWPFRSIEIDGRRVESFPAYLAFTAVPMAAGHHVVDWKEEVPGIAFSLWGPPLFVLIGVWISRRRPRAEPAA